MSNQEIIQNILRRLTDLEIKLNQLVDRELCDEIRKTWSISQADLPFSLGKARFVLETVITDIYRREVPNPKRKSLYKMIDVLSEIDGLFSKIIILDINYIRLVGNLSVHKQDEPIDITETDVEKIMHHIVAFVEWYLTQYIPKQNDETGGVTNLPISEYTLQEYLEPYLKWIKTQHSTLKLHGINEAGRLPEIPLEKVYVALRGDTTSTHERLQSRKLMDIEVEELLEKATEQGIETIEELVRLETLLVQQQPLMPSWKQKKQNKADNNDNDRTTTITLGKAFQKERWLVILGAPGGGKSTLARWLVLKLATALLKSPVDEKSIDVIVPAYQVDPDVNDNQETVNLGPARLPILVRVADYAMAYEKALSENEILVLANYLGHHSWDNKMPMHNGDFIPEDKLNALFKDALRNGRAVVILDGLDELTSHRRDILAEIETFIQVWINGHGQGNGIKNNQVRFEEPEKSGGNQIVITSRITGYQVSPISEEIAHVIVQPMRQNAVEHFCFAWTKAVYELLHPKQDKIANEELATIEATGLINAIYNDSSPRIRELATNPLLVTIIAIVYRNGQGKLPQQRAALYDASIQNLLNIWIEKQGDQEVSLTAEELIFILSPVAARIHQNYANGLITENELSELITANFMRCRYPEMDPEDPPLHLRTIVDRFLNTIKENVGLLAEQGQHVFGFLHLTFQEYLCARFLLGNKKRAAQEIIEHLDDPRWREPILLALGYSHSSSYWGPKARTELLETILNADDPLGDLIPRSALLIVTALPEIDDVPKDLITKITKLLINAYAEREGLGSFEGLREQLENALKNLYQSEHRKSFELVLQDILNHFLPEIPAVATLIYKHGWFTKNTVRALFKALPYDSSKWNWPVDKALRSYIIPPIPDLKGVKKEFDERNVELQSLQNNPQANKERLELLKVRIPNLKVRLKETEIQVSEYENKCKKAFETISIELKFRRALEQRPELIEKISEDIGWICLITALYGGFDDYGIVEPLRKLHLASQQVNLGLSDISEVEAIYGQASEITHTSNLAPQFKVKYIYRDCTLSTHILSALRNNKSAYSLIKTFWYLWDSSGNQVEQVDAMLGLIALGEDVIPVLDAGFNNAKLREVSEKALLHLERISSALQDPVVRTNTHIVKAIPRDIPTQHQIDLLASTIETLIANGSKPLEVNAKMPEKEFIECTNQEHVCYQDAETRAFLISGAGAGGVDDFDPTYDLAVLLDTSSNILFNSLTIESFASANIAKNRQWALGFDWRLVPIQTQFYNKKEAFLSALDAFEAIPQRLVFFRNHAIICCKSFVDENPDLLPIVLAFCLRDLESYYEVFLIFAPADVKNSRLLYEGVTKMALAIENPYYRFCALWRLVTRHFFVDINLVKACYQAIQEIDEPEFKIYALEKIFPFFSSDFTNITFSDLLNWVRQIEDPENKVRALARLALLEIEKQDDNLLLEALHLTEDIQNEHRRAETIQELRPLLGTNTNLIKQIAVVSQSFTDPWYKAKAMGQHNVYFRHYKEKLKTNLELWAPIALAANIKGIQYYFHAVDDTNSLWKSIADDSNDRVLEQLHEKAREKNLRLTFSAANSINQLLHKNEVKKVHCLLQIVMYPETQTLYLVEKWMMHVDPIINSYAALLLAESGKLTIEIVTHLIEFLTGDDDLGRYRAALSLYGKHLEGLRRNEFFRTSSVDIETLEFMMLMSLDYKKHDPKLAITFGWFFGELIHDDAEAFEHWINKLKQSQDIEITSHILSYINSITPSVWTVFISGLSSGNHDVQKALLTSTCRLFYQNNRHGDGQFLTESWSNLAEIISQMDQEVLADCNAPPIEPDKVIDAMNVSLLKLGDAPSRDLIAYATNEYKDFGIYLSDSIDKGQDELLEKVKNIGCSYIVGAAYWKNAKNAAKRIEENPKLLTLLINWLLEIVNENPEDSFVLYNVTEILSVLAATAQLMPATFSTQADPELLEQPLVDIVLYYNSFPARSAAVTLLGHLRYLSFDVTPALISANQDVSYVQQATMDAILKVRKFEDSLLPELFNGLKSPCASLAYASVQILNTIALDENTSSEQRKQIMFKLAEAIRDPLSKRDVYLLSGSFSASTITNIGSLDQVLYKSLFQISGGV